jgi:hypothetical protein
LFYHFHDCSATDHVKVYVHQPGAEVWLSQTIPPPGVQILSLKAKMKVMTTEIHLKKRETYSYKGKGKCLEEAEAEYMRNAHTTKIRVHFEFKYILLRLLAI